MNAGTPLPVEHTAGQRFDRLEARPLPDGRIALSSARDGSIVAVIDRAFLRSFEHLLMSGSEPTG
ncbi:MAG: hypothetical protein JRJ84_16055 [Deltaproteobacteria bacterium]|nr:hypothetical protein [Deltaproteobacteria bacterium]